MSAPLPIESLGRQYFEDYAAGAVYEFGNIKVEEAEIISFGERFDPQSFHIDAKAAAISSFGGLIASGWHTAGLAMRLLVEHYLPRNGSMGSPGVDEVRWFLPVRPGDELSVRVTIIEARLSRSKPDRGLVRTHIEVLNQDRDVAMSMKALNLFRTASAAPE